VAGGIFGSVPFLVRRIGFNGRELGGLAMLRVHFTGRDLARVRVAAGADPLWETILSLFRLRSGRSAPAFGDWRREALRASRPETLDQLLPVVSGRYWPDFFVPPEAALGSDAGVGAVASTPRARVRVELGPLGPLGDRPGALPRPLRDIAAGDAATFAAFVGALRTYYQTSVAPHWSAGQAHVDADRAGRTRTLSTGGVEALLDSFRPLMRWSYPVLEMDFPADHDVHLDGRGLLLVPSYFSWRMPHSLCDPSLVPVLVYPVAHDLAPARGTAGGDTGPLAALVGPTRARVLDRIGDGCTTGELAHRVGVTAGAISQHTGVLREAGLIRTTRLGRSVIHTLTPLGHSVLGDPGPRSGGDR
jgi:Helix-turn-helix domain